MGGRFIMFVSGESDSMTSETIEAHMPCQATESNSRAKCLQWSAQRIN